MPASQLPLKDIHVPEAIGWWPPALGWWLLAVCVPVLIMVLVWLYKRLTRKTAIKAAKKLLSEIKQDTDQDDFQKLSALSRLLRRAAVSIYPRAEIASLTGREWLAFLDRSVTGTPFTEGAGRILQDGHYRKTPPDDFNISALFSLCEEWLNAQTKQAKLIKRKK